MRIHTISFYFIIITSIISCGKKTEETKPIQKEITETVFASGFLEADNMYNLTAQSDGYIKQMNFNEGDNIAKGQVLLRIENDESAINVSSSKELYDIAVSNTNSNAPQLRQAETGVGIAKQKLDQEAIQVERYGKLWEANSIAKVEYENVQLSYNNAKLNYQAAIESVNKLKRDAAQQVVTQKAQKNLNAVTANKNYVKAQTTGKVYKKLKQIGDFVKRGETIAIIGDANNIYAKINVDESNIGKISLQQKALVLLNTQKEINYNAVVSEILPQFDEASRSYICKLKFTDSLKFSIINTPLQSNIIIGTPQKALLIPRNYLDFNNQVQVKGKKEKTKVVTKIVGNEWVQILSGINEQDILVTDKLASK
jgi:HlyD family secretion protein